MVSDHDLRLAAPADAAAVARLSRDAVERVLPWRWRAPRVRKAIDDPATNVVVAGPPGELRGLGIMCSGDEDAHLLLPAVRESWRRRGVATALPQWLEAAARTVGARRIRLEARRDNGAARGFYNERGYHERALAPRM